MAIRKCVFPNAERKNTLLPRRSSAVSPRPPRQRTKMPPQRPHELARFWRGFFRDSLGWAGRPGQEEQAVQQPVLPGRGVQFSLGATTP